MCAIEGRVLLLVCGAEAEEGSEHHARTARLPCTHAKHTPCAHHVHVMCMPCMHQARTVLLVDRRVVRTVRTIRTVRVTRVVFRAVGQRRRQAVVKAAGPVESFVHAFLVACGGGARVCSRFGRRVCTTRLGLWDVGQGWWVVP